MPENVPVLLKVPVPPWKLIVPLFIKVPSLSMFAPALMMSVFSCHVRDFPVGILKVPLGMVRLNPLASIMTELFTTTSASDRLSNKTIV